MKHYRLECLAALSCLALGLLSGLSVSAGDSSWYLQLIKPSFNPPAWIFGPVWTLLYLMMGVAFAQLWRTRAQNPGLIVLFLLQFIANLAWSPLFFGLHRLDLASYDITLLWLSLVLLIGYAWKKRWVCLLLLPYGLWVSFAGVLTWTLYCINT
jgi:tryptophan-rich sensory protein